LRVGLTRVGRVAHAGRSRRAEAARAQPRHDGRGPGPLWGQLIGPGAPSPRRQRRAPPSYPLLRSARAVVSAGVVKGCHGRGTRSSSRARHGRRSRRAHSSA
jgi:hypothetical protein